MSSRRRLRCVRPRCRRRPDFSPSSCGLRLRRDQRGPPGRVPLWTPRALGGSSVTPVETTKVAVVRPCFCAEHGPLPLVISSQDTVLVDVVGSVLKADESPLRQSPKRLSLEAPQARTTHAAFGSLKGSRVPVRRGACQLGASGRGIHVMGRNIFAGRARGAVTVAEGRRGWRRGHRGRGRRGRSGARSGNATAMRARSGRPRRCRGRG